VVPKPRSGASSKPTTDRANRWRPLFALRTESEEDRQTRELLAWIEAHDGKVTARELSRGPRQYRPAEAAERTLQALVAAGYGAWRVSATATNQTRVFTLATAATATHSRETRDSGESVTVASVTTPENTLDLPAFAPDGSLAI
jgi:hypothetical protein